MTKQIPSNTAASCKFSLVIPTYREASNISALLSELITRLDKLFPENYEIIVVDDDSPDETGTIAETFSKTNASVHVIKRAYEKGLASAVVDGWAGSHGKILGVMDGDFQHPPEILIRLLKELESGPYDLVVASRYVADGVYKASLVRRCISLASRGLGNLIVPRIFRRLKDPLSGFFVVRRDSIDQKTLRPIGYKILPEILEAGRIERLSELPYTFPSRKSGSSKMSGRVFLDFVWQLASLRSRTR